MARIRSVKPEFPQSETVGRLSRDARLLFIQIWTICDDSGRARAASRMLASLLYPYDEDAPALIPGWLDELEREGCIRLYEVDGSHYLDIPNWLKHQKIDKPSASRFPPFDEGSRVFDEASRKVAQDQGSRIKDQGRDQGEEWEGEREGEQARTSSAPAAPLNGHAKPPRGTRLPEDWTPDDEAVAFATGLGLNPAMVFDQFRDYWRAEAGAKARKVDWSATWRTWCRRDAGEGKRGVVRGESWRDRQARAVAEAVARSKRWQEDAP